MTQKRKGSPLGHPQKDLSLVVTHAVLSLFCLLVKSVGFSYRSHSCCSWYAQLVLTVVVTVECYSPMIDWLSLSLLLYLSVTSLSLYLSHSHPVSLIDGCLNHLITLFISGTALCSFFFCVNNFWFGSKFTRLLYVSKGQVTMRPPSTNKHKLSTLTSFRWLAPGLIHSSLQTDFSQLEAS